MGTPDSKRRRNLDAIIGLTGVRHRLSSLSVEEYHELGEYNTNGKRTELVRGIVIEKPRKSPRHSVVAVGLARLAERVVSEGFAVRVNAPLTFHDSEPEPDLAIVRGSDDDYQKAHPSTAVLVVEIVDGNDELERALASIYAEAGVDEYWIITVESREVEVYRLPVAGQYQEKTTVASVTCANVPGLHVSRGCWVV
jgi:Uma2 family endonuclease